MTFSQQQTTEDPIEIEAEQRGRRTYGMFPIANSEILKIVCFGLISLFLSFAHSSSRELKDSYFLEVMPSSFISYMKLVLVLPLNIIVNLSISVLLDKYSLQNIFAAVTLFYTIYFLVMGIVLIPLRHSLQISVLTTIDITSDSKIKFFGIAINMILPIYFIVTNWIVSLNSCLVEIFSSALNSFLMYAYFNTTCGVQQFKRFIPIIFICCNIGTIVSGFCLMFITNVAKNMSYQKSQSIFCSGFILVGVFCFAALCLQYVVNKYYPAENKRSLKKKEMPGIIDSLKVLLGSRVILAFSATVLFYNFMVNIVEIEYKANIQRYQSLYLNGSESMQQVSLGFQSKALLITGIVSTVIMMSPLKYSVNVFGWTLTGLATPVFFFLSSSVVFVLGIINFSRSSTDNEDALTIKMARMFNISHVEPLETLAFMKKSILCACIFVALTKAIKYSFFDVCKEAFSMEIDKNERSKYKAIYDGVCGKLGKSMSSVYLISCKGLFGANNTEEFTPVSVIVAGVIIVIWTVLVIYIGKVYKRSVVSNKPMDLGLISSGGEVSISKN
ncbi:ADP,ATP carrier protein 1 [Cucumispora dikerogammari]|nr:ADP,ATP carrier protein 1 [Cucumispora dikerogammari]